MVEAGEPGAPVVILGPRLSRNWPIHGDTRALRFLADAGYHVLAPDQRGYGSSRPEPIEAYDIHRLTADLVGLLEDVGAERAVWAATGVPWWCGTRHCCTLTESPPLPR